MDQVLALVKELPHLPPDVQEALLNGPAMVPPAGVKPNFENPPNRNHMSFALLGVCIFLVLAFFSLRVYARVIVAKKVRIDDGLAFLSVVAFAAFCWDYVAFSQVTGYWVHQYDIQLKHMGKVIIVGIWLPILYSLTMLFAKNAILLEWIRIFVPGRNRNLFFWSCVAVMVINTSFYSVTIILEGLACIPLKALWQPWVNGKCFNKKALDTTSAYVNLVVDLCILVLPQWVIWKLQMSRDQKLGVSMIFSVGIISVACAIGRVIFNYTVQYVGDKPGDLTYTIAPLFLWLLAELTCVIIVLCMPAVPKAFKEGYSATRLMASVRSWTRMRPGSSRNGSLNSDGVVSHHGAKAPSYKKHGQTSSDQESQVELTSLDSSRGIHYRENETGIVCKTHIAVHSTTNDEPQSENRNYPWEKK